MPGKVQTREVPSKYCSPTTRAPGIPVDIFYIPGQKMSPVARNKLHNGAGHVEYSKHDLN